jgi:hypothetical protein
MAKDLLEMEQDMRKHRQHPKFQTSVYRGVAFARGKWRSQITRNGKREEHGRFTTEVEAAIAYDTALRHIRPCSTQFNFTEAGDPIHIPPQYCPSSNYLHNLPPEKRAS